MSIRTNFSSYSFYGRSEEKRWVAPLKNTQALPHLYRNALAEVLLESVWPTRCTLCDQPGSLLCNSCRQSLPYIDYWRACPLCGAPWGTLQCSECNPVMLARLGKEHFPFTGCVSVVSFDSRIAYLINTYKDRNEQRLGSLFATCIAEVIPPLWLTSLPTITFIPASVNALRRRGFDHGKLLATCLASEIGLPVLPLFKHPQSKDQRSLSRKERIQNMEHQLSLTTKVVPPLVLIVDDVFTTGATLSAASSLLASYGTTVYCATFARV